MSVEFSSEEHIKHARKDHTCTLCGDNIKKGSSYETNAAKVEGCFFYGRYHHECAQMIEFAVGSGGECEYTMDDINETIREKFCWNCPDDEDCELSYKKCEKILKGIGYVRSVVDDKNTET